MKATINLPKNAIYMIHSAPSVKSVGCALVHIDKDGVPRTLMSGLGDRKFFYYPDTNWINGAHACHLVASHETDFQKISRRRINKIIKHWKRNADICNNAESAGDYNSLMAWYGGFVPSPKNK